tara:strand:- start:9225 stop:9665 length:441 start_codon:yes stop_codon:yes gene_type:complete
MNMFQARFYAFLERLMASMTQAVDVFHIQHPQRIRAGFFHPPAKLLFHHKTVEHHQIRLQPGDIVVKRRAVKLQFGGFHSVVGQRHRMRTPVGWRTKHHPITTRLQCRNQLQHAATRSGRCRLRPDVADNQSGFHAVFLWRPNAAV